MIVPSIDIQENKTVQLIGGEELAIDAGNPHSILKGFAPVGEVAAIDLDAARGIGDNSDMIASLLPHARCRVGGGIRDLERAVRWLDAGAVKIILGTAATEEWVQLLPKDRVIAALDSRDGEIVVKGWRQKTGANILERIAELKDRVGGFLVTFVEREGRLGGTDMERAKQIIEAAAPLRVTFAGGITTTDEIAELHRLGADAQVGMALYSGRMDLAKATAAPLQNKDCHGLWPTVVTNESGQALGLVYSNLTSLRASLKERRGIYWSRTRNSLWRKGETSGNWQELVSVDLDCDADTIRFTVRQHGTGFCHLGTDTCWGNLQGIPSLEKTIRSRLGKAPKGSYTHRLLHEPSLLASKLREEADELLEANTHSEIIHEAADLFYFAAVVMVRGGVGFDEVAEELDRRALKVTRRPGNAKETLA